MEDGKGVDDTPNPVESEVKDLDTAWNKIQKGSDAREIASNNVNVRSSRSH